MSSSGRAALLFDPLRLAQARRLRGLLKSELALAIGVTPAALSQFEAGANKPSPGTLSRLAIALGVPVTFLTHGREIFQVAEGEANFRSLRSTTKRERSQARAQVELLAEVVDLVERYLQLPAVNLSELANDPERAADAVREEWGLGFGPVADVVGLLERHGVIVARLPSESDRVDAFSCWIQGRPYVLLASNKQTADRSRFDAAHELGHLILHPDALPGLGEAELEAHRFAAAFLMPRTGIQTELPRRPDFGRLVDLKLRWRVSVQALIRRAHDLGVFSDAAYRRAYRQLGSQGWRTVEPGDVGPPEQPQLLLRSTSLLNDRYGSALKLLAQRTQLPTDELQKLLSMFGEERPIVEFPSAGSANS